MSRLTLRKWLFAKDGGKCCLCGRVDTPWHMDRVIPGYLGGGYTTENVRTLCRGCHQDETNRLRKENPFNRPANYKLKSEKPLTPAQLALIRQCWFIAEAKLRAGVYPIRPL